MIEVKFEDGSRWEGLDVAIPEGMTPEEAVKDAIQSLIDMGEFEDCVARIE